MSDQTHCLAEVPTPKASRYLQQLCKHFQHKIPATFDERSGRVEFSSGECRLEAGTDVLSLKLSAPDSDSLAQLQEVVGSHLQRFAFREPLQIEWRETAAPGT